MLPPVQMQRHHCMLPLLHKVWQSCQTQQQQQQLQQALLPKQACALAGSSSERGEAQGAHLLTSVLYQH
jgi:hypothetical protein